MREWLGRHFEVPSHLGFVASAQFPAESLEVVAEAALPGRFAIAGGEAVHEGVELAGVDRDSQGCTQSADLEPVIATSSMIATSCAIATSSLGETVRSGAVDTDSPASRSPRPLRRALPDRLRWIGVLALVALGGAACSSDDTGAEESAGLSTAQTPSPETAVPEIPSPPQLPDDFTWSGRYIVPDLDVEVPFTWVGRDGEFQMVAGGEDEPIHFTNIVADGYLYTLTYTWPGIERRECSPVGEFTTDELNEGLADAAYVGAEVLEGDEPRDVYHYRSAGALEVPPELLGLPADAPVARIPLMSGDIYVDRDDPSVIRKLLHFGVQNLYDANLDEWIVIDEVSTDPREVTVPQECLDARDSAEAQ